MKKNMNKRKLILMFIIATFVVSSLLNISLYFVNAEYSLAFDALMDTIEIAEMEKETQLVSASVKTLRKLEFDKSSYLSNFLMWNILNLIFLVCCCFFLLTESKK